MVTHTDVLVLVQIAVAVIVILAAAKSAWSGILRQVYVNIMYIPDIKEEMERVHDDVSTMADVVTANSYAIAYPTVAVDPHMVEEALQDEDEGVRRFIKEGEFTRGDG